LGKNFRKAMGKLGKRGKVRLSCTQVDRERSRSQGEKRKKKIEKFEKKKERGDI